MAEKKKSIEKFVKEQIKKWEGMYSKKTGQAEERLPVITVSSEPGSGGTMVAQEIAKRLDFELILMINQPVAYVNVNNESR